MKWAFNHLFISQQHYWASTTLQDLPMDTNLCKLHLSPQVPEETQKRITKQIYKVQWAHRGVYKLSLEGKGRIYRGGDVDEARVTVYTHTTMLCSVRNMNDKRYYTKYCFQPLTLFPYCKSPTQQCKVSGWDIVETRNKPVYIYMYAYVYICIVFICISAYV